MMRASQMRVYFDYNATTPVDPRVLEAMLPYTYQVTLEEYPLKAGTRDHRQEVSKVFLFIWLTEVRG